MCLTNSPLSEYDYFQYDNSAINPFQTEAKVSSPDCQSLSQSFVKLWKSNEKRIKKYQQKWDTFFNAAALKFHSEIYNLGWYCDDVYAKVSYPYDIYYDPVVETRKEDIILSQKDLKCGKLPDISNFEKYIKSSGIEARIRLAKKVEDECDAEVFRLWHVLISFELKLPLGCQTKITRQLSFVEVSSSNIADALRDFQSDSHLSDDDVVKKTVNIYQNLIDNIDNDSQFGHVNMFDIITKFDNKIKKIKEKSHKTHSDKVFVRSVQRMKRFEQKTRKLLVSLKIELLFKNRRTYLKTDLEKLVSYAIDNCIFGVNKNSTGIWKRVAALMYQMSFIG